MTLNTSVPEDRPSAAAVLFGSPGSLFSAAGAEILFALGLLRAVVVPVKKGRRIAGQPAGTLLSAALLHMWQRARIMGRNAGLRRSGPCLSLDEFLRCRDVPSVAYTTRKRAMESRLEPFRGQEDLVLISCGFPKKIPVDLGLFSLMVNIHPGILPGNRGPCPYFWALAGGTGRTGVSMHLLTDEYDSGDILISAETGILPTSTEFGLEMISAELLGSIIPRFMSNPASLAESAAPQTEGDCFGRPTAADRRRFSRRAVISISDFLAFRKWKGPVPV
jgi:hypothetical protein